MRLGTIQLGVLVAARDGRATVNHAGQGRMVVFGVDVPEPPGDRVIDRLLALDLLDVVEDETRANSRPLVLTPAGWVELERRGQGHPDHRLTLSRHSRGVSPIAGGGTMWGVTGRCGCGWHGKSNEPPNKGGKDRVRVMHGSHVHEASGS